MACFAVRAYCKNMSLDHQRKVIGLYKNHRSPKPNVPSEEEAITKLSHDKSRIVNLSDKCKGFVIMKEETYVH